jgi:hypothetical protein
MSQEKKERFMQVLKRGAFDFWKKSSQEAQLTRVALIGFETLFNGKAYTEEGCNVVSSRA